MRASILLIIKTHILASPSILLVVLFRQQHQTTLSKISRILSAVVTTICLSQAAIPACLTVVRAGMIHLIQMVRDLHRLLSPLWGEATGIICWIWAVAPAVLLLILDAAYSMVLMVLRSLATSRLFSVQNMPIRSRALIVVV